MTDSDPSARRRMWPMRRRVLALVIVVPILLIAAATIRPPRIFCDNVVAPVWAGDPCGDGFVPTLLEYVWPPEHWFAPSECYGLCGSPNLLPAR
jgi:hypothetical protein